MSEDDPTPEELEEARALAEALDGNTANATEPPRDALEAAALLRYAQESELDSERESAILRGLGEPAEGAGSALSLSRRRWRLVVPAAAIMAAAAAAAVAILWRTPGSELPPPHLGLLRAQAEVIGAQDQSFAELQAQNDRYRERWLVSMRDHYEGTQ